MWHNKLIAVNLVWRLKAKLTELTPHPWVEWRLKARVGILTVWRWLLSLVKLWRLLVHHIWWLLWYNAGRTTTRISVHAHVLWILVHLIGGKTILISTVLSSCFLEFCTRSGWVLNSRSNLPDPVRVPCDAEVLSFVRCSYDGPSALTEGIHFQHRRFLDRLGHYLPRPAIYS